METIYNVYGITSDISRYWFQTVELLVMFSSLFHSYGPDVQVAYSQERNEGTAMKKYIQVNI